MAESPSAQDVADALAMTLEREDISGAPWCPPSDAVALRRWVIDRSAPLGTGIRRAARLARLMALADGRDYVSFLYVRVPALRARHFRHAIEAAFAEGRIDASVATPFDAGVRLRETALLPQAETHDGFEIDFAQMPRLAALLDILHNTLGFTVVADLLAPLLGHGPPSESANDVARKLQAALNAWLSERLESTNHIMQARRMRAFLASRGRVTPEAINNEAILLFWTAMAEAAEDERVDGFRLYRSTAAAMLRYRYALRDSATAKFLEDSFARGWEPANDELGVDQVTARPEPWRSPLTALASPPANRVKWLTGKELNGLVNYLGGPSDDGSENTADDPDAATWKGGLAGEERFDIAFWLTLLRADVFGTAQASIVGQLRKRATEAVAITQTMADIEDDAYASAGAFYGDLCQQLRLESLAALAVLMDAGAMEAVLLLDSLGGSKVVAELSGQGATDKAPTDENEEPVHDKLQKEIAPRLKLALADPSSVPEGPARALLHEAIAAIRKVNRVGFRREDRADPQMLAALRAGATAIFAIVRELERLTAALAPKLPGADLKGDREHFAATFRRIYLA